MLEFLLCLPLDALTKHSNVDKMHTSSRKFLFPSCLPNAIIVFFVHFTPNVIIYFRAFLNHEKRYRRSSRRLGRRPLRSVKNVMIPGFWLFPTLSKAILTLALTIHRVVSTSINYIYVRISMILGGGGIVAKFYVFRQTSRFFSGFCWLPEIFPRFRRHSKRIFHACLILEAYFLIIWIYVHGIYSLELVSIHFVFAILMFSVAF